MGFLCLLLIVCVNISVKGYWIEEGGVCEKRNGESGVCVHFSNCISAINEVKKNGRPEICSFNGKFPIVCCQEGKTPTKGQPKPEKLTQSDDHKLPYLIPFDENSISLRKCSEYHQKKEIDIDPFILGRDSASKEYPHMALLGFGNESKIQWECGGSLISERFVLTAAHCLYSSTYGKLKYVRLGELDINSTIDDADPQDFTVKNVYPHPDYKASSRYHDIALVELDRLPRFTDYVKTICLAVTKNVTFISPEAMGWGLTEYGGDSANILQTGYLRFVTNENCRKIYGTSVDLKDGILDDLLICADGGTEKRDTCHGDSGGPLQIKNYFYEFNIFPEIVGITSFGKGCALTAGVYTRVYPYVSWIEKIVWPNL